MIKKLIILALIAVTSYAEQITLGLIADLSWQGAMAKWAKDQPTGEGIKTFAHYKMNDSATSYDVVDSSTDGTRTGTAIATTDTLTMSGRILGALSFNGTSDYVDVGTTIQNAVTEYSVSAWVFVPTGSAGGIIFSSRGNYSVEGNGFYLSTASGGVTFFVDGSGLIMGRSSTTATPVDEWFHVVGVFSSVADESLVPSLCRVYQNGVQVDDTDANYGSGTSPITGGQTRIGFHEMWGGYFQGSLDDIRVYDRALVQAEIDELYNSGAGTEEELTYQRQPE